MISMILKRQIAAKKNRKKGFTLIELIVVIVIIAILAAIAVPSLTRYIGSAEQRAIQASAHNVQVVLQSEKSTQYQVNFVNGAGTDSADGAGGDTYIAILAAAGVTLGDSEVLSNITWDGNNLITFTLANNNYSITYDSSNGGFQEVVSL